MGFSIGHVTAIYVIAHYCMAGKAQANEQRYTKLKEKYSELVQNHADLLRKVGPSSLFLSPPSPSSCWLCASYYAQEKQETLTKRAVSHLCKREMVFLLSEGHLWGKSPVELPPLYTMPGFFGWVQVARFCLRDFKILLCPVKIPSS